MRQILVCAWLLVTSAAVAACGGEKFSPSEASSAPNGSDASSGGSKSSSDNDGSSSGSSVQSPGGMSLAGQATSSAGAASEPEDMDAAGSSSGGSGTSGGAASGGAASSGGSAPGDECAGGSVTFKMLPGPDLPHDYLCDAGCGTGWLSITDASGATAYTLFAACGTASCESCEVQPCAASACLPSVLTSEGSSLEWNGTYMAKDTCGADMACQKPACVKPGRYKAKACASVSGGPSDIGPGCTPKNEQLCAEAEFELPGTTTVRLVLEH